VSACLDACLSYPACKAYLTWAVLYCHPCPVWLCHIFLHYFIKGTIFEKMVLNMKCAFWFSLQVLPEKFLIPRRIQRDTALNVHSHHAKYLLFVSYFNETRIFSTDFRKMLKCKILWKSIQQEPGERQTWQSWQLLFEMLRTRLKRFGDRVGAHSNAEEWGKDSLAW
jgi:hypothetical protein